MARTEARAAPPLPVQGVLLVPEWSGYGQALVEELLRGYGRRIYKERGDPVEDDDDEDDPMDNVTKHLFGNFGRMVPFTVVGPQAIIEEIQQRAAELDSGPLPLIIHVTSDNQVEMDRWKESASTYGVYCVEIPNPDGDGSRQFWTGSYTAIADFSFAVNMRLKMGPEDVDA